MCGKCKKKQKTKYNLGYNTEIKDDKANTVFSKCDNKKQGPG